MAEINEKHTTYVIPDNFVDEPRWFQGLVRRRYFLEGCVLGIIPVIIVLLVPMSDITKKILAVLFTAAPFIMIGCIGYNGDPLSVAFTSARNYYKNRAQKIYNQQVRVLKYSRTEELLNEEVVRDKLVASYEARQQKKQEKLLNEKAIPGKTFEFEYDPDVDDYTQKKRRNGKKNATEHIIKTKPKEEKISIDTTKTDMSDFDDLYDLDEDIPLFDE